MPLTVHLSGKKLIFDKLLRPDHWLKFKLRKSLERVGGGEERILSLEMEECGDYNTYFLLFPSAVTMASVVAGGR